MPSPYRQACRNNAPACTCTVCFSPMRWAKPQICDNCYADLSKSGQLRKEPACQPTSK